MKKYPDDIEQKFIEDPDHYFPGTITGVKNSSPKCENCNDGGRLVYFHLKDDEPQGPSSVRANHYLTINGIQGWYDAEMILCVCPVCQGSKVIAELRNRCGLEGIDLGKSLANFTHAGPTSGKQVGYSVASDIINSGNPHGLYTFWGDYGVGKSHLLKSIVNAYTLAGTPAKYTTMTGLLSEIKATFSGNGITQEAVEEGYSKVRVLCIDEVDRVKLTDWAEETIFRLMDRRYSRRLEYLTVMATNIAPQNMPPALGYLRSRMQGGAIVNVGGPDMRPAIGAIEQRAAQEAIHFEKEEPQFIESEPTNNAIAQAVTATAERMMK